MVVAYVAKIIAFPELYTRSHQMARGRAAFSSMIPLGALETSGGTELISGALDLTGELAPWMILTVLLMVVTMTLV
jgi:hypothetical protein